MRKFGAHLRYLGARWGKVRRMHLMRHPQCARCAMPAEEVHHIIPRSVAPELRFSHLNLMSLCKACHHAHHNPKKPHFDAKNEVFG